MAVGAETLRAGSHASRRLGLDAADELLAAEELDGAVELASETRCGILPQLAHALVEGQRRGLDLPLELAREHPLDPLGLPSLELHERDLEAAAGVGLGALDTLGDRRLAHAEPLRDLVDRATPLGRLALELVERLGHRLGGRALELLAEAQHGLALLLGGRPDLGGLCLDPMLDVDDRLPVALLEPGELGLEVALRPVEIVGERLQPLVDAALGLGEPFRERVSGEALAGLEGTAPLVGDATFLGRERRDRLSALPCEQTPDLVGVRRRLLFDDGAQPRARGSDQLVDRGRPRPRTPNGDRQSPTITTAAPRGSRRGSRRSRSHSRG